MALVLTFRSVEMAQSDSSLRMEVATIPTYVYINMYIYIYTQYSKRYRCIHALRVERRRCQVFGMVLEFMKA